MTHEDKPLSIRNKIQMYEEFITNAKINMEMTKRWITEYEQRIQELQRKMQN